MDAPHTHTSGCRDPHYTLEHLCCLMYEGFHLSHPKAYKAMVQDARYRCRHCGRTAHSPDNLCGPVLL